MATATATKSFLDGFFLPTIVIISMQQIGHFPTVQTAEAMVAIRVHFLVRSSVQQFEKFGSEYKNESENLNSLSLYRVTVTTISTNAKY